MADLPPSASDQQLVKKGQTSERLGDRSVVQPSGDVLGSACDELPTKPEGKQVSRKMTRFESLLEAVPDALVGMDQKGVIRFVNRQTEWLFGYDRDDVVGKPIETLVPEYLWPIYIEHRKEYFLDPRTRSSGLDLQLTGRHRDGAALPVNISMSHIDTGDVLLVVAAVSDVTTRRPPD